MKLIFYGRQASAAVPLGSALLTIDHKGVFSFSTGAVADLRLTTASSVVLASDAETNRWYVVLQLPAGEESFVLKPRDGKGSKALVFHSQPQARAYWQAHGLNGQKSVRTLVSATPLEHEGLKLYPLTPQHPTQTPAPIIGAPADVLEHLAEIRETVFPSEVASQPDVAPLPSDLPFLQAQQPAAAAEVTPTPTAAPSTKSTSKFTAEQDVCLLAEGQHLPDLAKKWDMSAASLYARRSYLRSKMGAAPVPPVVAAPATPAGPTLIYTPAPAGGVAQAPKTFGLQARAQELTSYWMERDISNTTPGELAEILNLMRHIPEGKRGIEMSLVLDRAETEQTHRLTAAGKGGKRG